VHEQIAAAHPVVAHGGDGEVAVPRRLFADILSLIARLRAPPRRHD